MEPVVTAPPQNLLHLAQLQAHVECMLDHVQRWGNFQTSSQSRSQTTLAHTASVNLVGTVTIDAISSVQPNDLPFDPAYVLKAFGCHDFGEITYVRQGQDVLYDNKSQRSDLEEIAAFQTAIQALLPEMQLRLLEYYLLQYVSREIQLEEPAQSILQRLRAERTQEYFVFEAVERLDYLLYALEEYRARGNLRIVVHVLRRSHATLKLFAHRYKGFGEQLYTPEFIDWAEQLIHSCQSLQEGSIPDRSP